MLAGLTLMGPLGWPVVVANLIGWPLAYVAARAYLNVFIQPIALGVLPFLSSLVLTLLIAGVAVARQTWRTAHVKPAAVLFAGSAMGRDLAPRVAARLDAGLATDCTVLAVEGGKLVATRPIYAGKATQKVGFTRAPAMVSLRPKVFAPHAGNGGAAKVTPLSLAYDPQAARAHIVDVKATSAGKADLTEAEISRFSQYAN